MRLSDDEWTAAARKQLDARGDWHFEYRAPAVADEAASAGLRCPWCTGRPPLEVFRRREVVTESPLLYCRSCYGFWAAGDALAPGVADSGDESEPLYAAPAPRRCRSCLGHLKPDGVCSKCHRPLPRLACPSCQKEMDRFEKDGVTLDACAACRGTWFDVGEIGRAYRLVRPQSLAARQVAEADAPSGSQLVLGALDILLRVFLPAWR